VKGIEFCLPHDHGEACGQECREQEERIAERREGLQAEACQPTIIRAPVNISESPNFRAVESFLKSGALEILL
jgi:hypothetical protein